MRIDGFHVGGFGLLHDLEVEGLPTGVTVVVGPNEAGKSTLHTFLVRTLFGHPRTNDVRGRDRYEPLGGGRHGGVIRARDDDGGAWTIHRFTTGSPVLRVITPDGAESTRAEVLTPLLGHGMDEDRFEQVFAVDLDALAGLGALGGPVLDELLLDAATVGAGRSLRGAIARLEQRRDEMWVPRGRKPPLNAALAARREAERGLRAARDTAGSYARARGEVARLEAERDRLADEQERTASRVRELELLEELWPTWQEVTAAQEQLAATGEVVVSEELAAAVDDLEAQRDDLVRRAQDARAAAAAAARAAAGIAVDDTIHAVAEQVLDHAEGLGVQRDRRQRLAQAGTAADAAAMAAREAVELLPDGWEPDRVAGTPTEPNLPPQLRGAVERLRSAQQELAASQRAYDHARRTFAEAQAVAGAATEAVGPPPADDMPQRQAAVSALRGLLPEVEHLERQAAPPPATARWLTMAAAALTLALVLGGAAGFATGQAVAGGLALAAAILAVVVTIGSVRAARAAGREQQPASTAVADLQQQVVDAAGLLELTPPVTRQQVEQAALAVDRLATERDEQRRREEHVQQAQDALAAAEVVRAEAEQQHLRCRDAVSTARTAWAEVASRAGLDPDTDPDGAAELLAAVGEARRALRTAAVAAAGRDELAVEVAAFDRRTGELRSAAGDTGSAQPDAALSRLVERCQADAQARATRARHLEESEGHRQRAVALDAALEPIAEALTEAYQQAGVGDAAGFAMARASDQDRRGAVERRERAEATLRRRLGAGDRAVALRRELGTGRVAAWGDELASAQRRARTLTAERDAVVADHTTAAQRLREIGDDDAVARAAIEVERLTERCRELAEEWARADLAGRLLSATLERFEQAHQPAVLHAAGELLSRATAGRWFEVRRIDDELFVAAGGDPVPARALSRGATEQLYLCLRLALADERNRHQLRLPLLIDDLMANADPQRADGLAGILAEVAERQQVIVFTCNPTTAARIVEADPGAGVLALAPAGGGAVWQR